MNASVQGCRLLANLCNALFIRASAADSRSLVMIAAHVLLL